MLRPPHTPFPNAGKVSATILAALLLSGASCKGGPQGGSVKHFPLTLALSERLGEAGSPLPEDIKALLRPLEANNCPGALFIPDVRVVRLDIPETKPEQLDLGQDQNEIQKAAGQAPKPDKARSVREEALKKLQITALMGQPSTSEEIRPDSVRKLLGANEHMFLTEATRARIRLTVNPNNVTVVRSLDELTASIVSRFCGKPGTKPQPSACAIVYTPTLASVATGHAAEPRTHSSPPPITPTPTPPTSHGDADNLYDQLSSEVEEAIAGQVEKRAVHAKLAKAQAEMTWDYRFTYERAKLAVYGTERHDEAFSHLYRAAEIAIENGYANQMLQRLQKDAGDTGPFHRLSHGHREWKTLHEGLHTRNSRLVRR